MKIWVPLELLFTPIKIHQIKLKNDNVKIDLPLSYDDIWTTFGSWLVCACVYLSILDCLLSKRKVPPCPVSDRHGLSGSARGSDGS